MSLRAKIILIILSVASFLIIILIENNQIEETENKQEDDFINKIKKSQKEDFIVAACPTFHHLLDNFEIDNVIKTESTAQSLMLIQQKEVDFLISGRALRQQEPKLDYLIIGRGYDFLFEQELIIPEQDMKYITFYTDLDKQEIINDFQYISEDNLNEVKDINLYLDKGIIITNLPGKLIGEPVHIITSNNSRVPFSRLPRLYYYPNSSQEKIDFIIERIN